MTCKPKLWLIFSMLVFAFELQLVLGQPKVPCVYSFGDSLADNGNNNVLKTVAKCNYQPYGVDFRDGPTGRFTNGRTRVDFITQLLGFDDFIKPLATVNGNEILKGVNYASGAGGILPDTGLQGGRVYSMTEQLILHRKTVLDNKLTADQLNKCLYLVGFGSNDYINNYLHPEFYNSSRDFTPEAYADNLIKKYTEGLESLYELGARKVAIFSMGGCTPYYMDAGGACVKSVFDVVAKFDDLLKPLVVQLNQKHPDARFTLLNLTSIFEGLPAAAGIPIWNKPCCKVIPISGLCIPLEKPCEDRTKYGFYDMFHPAEITNEWIAKRAITAHTSADAYPDDISHLIQPGAEPGIPASGGGNPASGGGTPASGGGIPASGGGTPASGGGIPANGGGTPASGGGIPNGVSKVMGVRGR